MFFQIIVRHVAETSSINTDKAIIVCALQIHTRVSFTSYHLLSPSSADLLCRHPATGFALVASATRTQERHTTGFWLCAGTVEEDNRERLSSKSSSNPRISTRLSPAAPHKTAHFFFILTCSLTFVCFFECFAYDLLAVSFVLALYR